MERRTFDHCKIQADIEWPIPVFEGADEKVSNEIENGLVLTNGDQAKILVHFNGKPHQLDRVVNARLEIRGKTAIITGRSSYLQNDLGVPPEDQNIEVRVSNWRGCAHCG